MAEMGPVSSPDVVLAIEGEPTMFIIWCEGCRCCHQIDTTRWTFNRDTVRPTVTPSLLVNKERAGGDPLCHSFITDGRIRYLKDSTHELAGQTVAMIPPP